ncbi:MAG: hypothetical protein QW622_01990 [Candidatus Pacearchaeota archaeon]
MLKKKYSNIFLRNFFNSLVLAYIELQATELEKKKEEKERKIEKVEEVVELEKKKLEEKIEGKKKIRMPPILRTFELEKISAKELTPKPPLPVPKPGAKERMLETMKEFKPEITAAIPSVEIKKEITLPAEIPKTLIFGRLNEIVYNENFDSLQCIEDNSLTITYKDGKIETKEIKLNKDELKAIIKQILEKTRMPMEKEVSVYFENFFVQAFLNEKIKLIIKKII